jgi:hypothetical protein
MLAPAVAERAQLVDSGRTARITPVGSRDRGLSRAGPSSPARSAEA